MSEGEEGQQPYIKDQESTRYKSETVQYQNGQLAILLTGEPGSKFDWKHKWSPTVPLEEGEAIVSTKSGNDYYVFSDDKGIYIINTRESFRKGKTEGAYHDFSANFPLPSIEFGKSWELPGFYTTSDVGSVLLKYKIGDVGRKIDEPNPFDKYKSLFKPAS